MKDINIDDIKVSSKLDEVIKNAATEGYKDIKYKNTKRIRKSAIAATIAASFCIAIVGTVFSNEISATVKLAMFDIRNYLGINRNLDDYKTVVNSAISKDGVTVQLNEVILDKDEIIVSTTIKSDENLDNNGHISLHGNVYINGNRISSAAGGSSKQIDEYTEEVILTYKLDKELQAGDLDIEIKYDSAYLYINDRENKVNGPWKFEFTANGDTLAANSKSIKIGNSFVLENGQKITLNEYRSNDIGQKIYYSIENKDKNNVYDLVLKGHDDLGNEVEFYSSYEEITSGVMKNQIEISSEAKILTLTPYAVAYPKESGKMSHDYKITGEEFTIIIK